MRARGETAALQTYSRQQRGEQGLVECFWVLLALNTFNTVCSKAVLYVWLQQNLYIAGTGFLNIPVGPDIKTRPGWNLKNAELSTWFVSTGPLLGRNPVFPWCETLSASDESYTKSQFGSWVQNSLMNLETTCCMFFSSCCCHSKLEDPVCTEWVAVHEQTRLYVCVHVCVHWACLQLRSKGAGTHWLLSIRVCLVGCVNCLAFLSSYTHTHTHTHKYKPGPAGLPLWQADSSEFTVHKF